jgi:hypothetical protein
MSLAHLRAPKVGRTRKPAGAPAVERVALGPVAYCGASREPVYRTLNEASESGLEICDTCLADSRRQRKPGH